MKLLDSDTFTLASYGKPGLTERVATARDAGDLLLPSIVRLEVLLGRIEAVLKAENGHEAMKMSERLSATEDYLGTFQVVPIDPRAVGHFDRLRLLKQLKKIGRRDVLIASIALAHDATLVTRNTKDFKNVPGLRLENWAD